MSDQTTTTKQDLPDWLKKPSQRALGSVEDFLNSDANYVYGSKPGETLHVGLSDMQQESLGNVDWLADQNLADMFGFNDADAMMADYTGAGAQTLNLSGDPTQANLASLQPGDQRVIDENGMLGSIESYMNPYLDTVLDNQIRRLNESSEIRRNNLGAEAAAAGAFGDARHGINESLVYQDLDRAVGDATGTAYANAYDNAMGLRTSDLNRIFQGNMFDAGQQDTADARDMAIAESNQAAEERALERTRTGAADEITRGQQYLDTFSNINDMLYNAGQIEQDDEVARNEALRAYQEAVKNKEYDDAIKLLSAINGTPMPNTTTQTSQSNDNGDIWGAVGALAGAFF